MRLWVIIGIRENKQVKDLYKKGELELENKDYVQTVLEKEEEPRERGETKRREESEKEKSVEPCCQLIIR